MTRVPYYADRHAMKLTPYQYAQLVLALQAEVMPGQPGIEAHIAEKDAELEQMRGEFPDKGNLRGGKETINELLQMGSPFLPWERQRLDADLKRRGLPPLHVIEAAHTRKIKGIVRRGRIRDMEEFYIVKGILDDIDDGSEDKTRESLGRIMAAYEAANARSAE